MTHASREVRSSPRAPLEPRSARLAFAAAAPVAGAAPYTGEPLRLFVKVDPKVEVVDHVVLAAVIVIVCGFVLISGRFPLRGVSSSDWPGSPDTAAGISVRYSSVDS